MRKTLLALFIFLIGMNHAMAEDAPAYAAKQPDAEIIACFADQEGARVVRSESALYLQTDAGYSKAYETIDPFAQNAAIVSVNFQYGLIDRQGRELLPCRYQSIERWDDCYVICENYLYGLADLDGSILVEPAYHELYYQDGTAAVAIAGENGGAGVIARDGTPLVPLIFHQAAPFDLEWAWVQKKDAYQCNYVNADGCFLLEEDVAACEGFYGEYLIVSTSSGSYLVNRAGAVCSPETKMELSPLDHECLFLMADEREAFIWNAAKQEAHPCEYKTIRAMSGGRYAVYNGEKWGFLDANFQPVIPCVYDQVGAFCQERAWVQSEGVYHLIDQNGSILFSEKLLAACSFSEGLAAIQTENGWGFIDREGSVLLPPSLQADGMGIYFVDGVCNLIPYDPYASMFLNSNFEILSYYDLFDDYTQMIEYNIEALNALKTR